MYDPLESHSTSEPDYSPHSLLPSPEPRSYNPAPTYFYDNVAKHLIKDTVRLMNNGLHINLERVSELEETLDSQLSIVEQELASNPLVQSYLEQTYSAQIKAYTLDRESKCRSPEYYLKPFDHKNMHHRSYFMYFFSKSQSFSGPSEEVHPGIPKWPALKVKKLVPQFPILARLLDGKLTDSHPLVKQALSLLAQHKADIYNSKFLSQIENPDVPYPVFNPASSKDVPGVFALAGVESETFSKKTGNPSFNRAELERLQHEIIDETILHLIKNLLDYSSAAIVRNNFINAFYKFSITNSEGRSTLHGSYKLLGALSARFTSNNPNMLNMPSTGSVFAKSIKQCFEAPPGFVISSIDFSSLEDRVLASLTNDPGKCAIYEQDLDSHSFNSVGYYPDEVSQYMNLTGNQVEDAREFFRLVNEGHKELKAIRQKSKPVTFKCAYLGMPDSHKGGSITPEVYDNYHKNLYPSILDQVDNYILPTLRREGKLHLGLGFPLYVDNPDEAIRSANNALNQFWSILSILTINKLHLEIDKAGLQDDILVTSSIYDSIYFCVRKDSNIIKWLNDTIIPIMSQDFMENQRIHNTCDLCIGTSWADVEDNELPHNCSKEYIEELLSRI